jgi:hypothetical protein
VSARVCHIERIDRGGLLAGLRLVGPRTEDRWSAPLESLAAEGEARVDAVGDAQSNARDAAAWVAERLKEAGRGKRIDRVVLDADGAVCSWVTASSIEPKVVRALVEQHAGGSEGDGGLEDAGHDSGPGRFPDLPGELGVQPLVDAFAAPPSASSDAAAAIRKRFESARGQAKKALEVDDDGVPSAQRIAVMAMPEVPARLLLDELDRAGVEVGSVGSVFHAAASVWDPAARTAKAKSEDEDPLTVEAEPGLTLVVLVDIAGRLVWCWSKTGGVAASGSARLPGGTTRGPVRQDAGGVAGERAGAMGGAARIEGDRPTVRITSQTLARLTGEWLSWATQLGHVPTRVVAVAPFASLEVGPPEANGAGGLDATGLATALRRALPAATVDLVDDEDPVGLTLRRLAELHDDGSPAVRDDGTQRRGLMGLSRRPGRAHRAMYRWSAAALVAASLAVSAVSWSLFQEADGAGTVVAELRTQRRELLESIDARLVMSPFASRELQAMVDTARQGVVTAESLPPPPPALAELETLSYLLANEAYDLTTLSIGPFAASFTVVVDDIGAAEELRSGLTAIAGSNVIWSDPTLNTQSGGRVSVQANGVWRQRPAAGTAGGIGGIGGGG